MSNHHITDLTVPILTNKSRSPPLVKHQTSRSITDTPFPAPKLHKHHIHRHKDKETHTGLQPHTSNNGGATNTGLDGSKSEGVTPTESRIASRRTSLLGASTGGVSVEIEGSDIANGWREERRVVKDEEVEKEKQNAVLRATELRNVLNNLNTGSNSSMMRLDSSYYSVLEKLSVLQSTVTSMKELARIMDELNEDFKQESEEIIAEVETSLTGFENFDHQQTRIESLAARVKKGRDSIKDFGERVEVVREKVDGWESAELEWQERTRKRLKILWIVMAVCGVLFLGLMAFQMTPVRTQGPGVIKGMNASGLRPPNYEEIKNEPWSLNKPKQDVLGKIKAQSKEKEKEKGVEDPRLRIFDEL